MNVKRDASIIPLVLVAVSLASAHVFSRLAFDNGVDVNTGAAMRTLCVVVLVAAYIAYTHGTLMPRARLSPALFGLGALLAVQTLSIQFAVARLPVTLAVLLFYTHPVITNIAALILARKIPSAATLGALLSAFAGVFLVLGVSPQPISAIGVGAAMLAACSFSALLILTPKAVPTMAPIERTLFTFAAAAAILCVVVFERGGGSWPANGAGWVGLLGLMVFYAIGIIGLFSVLPRFGPAQTAIVLNLEPVAVALIAWMVLGQGLTFQQIAGVLLVVAAVTIFKIALTRPETPTVT